MTKKDKLLPCPFCGNNDIQVDWFTFDQGVPVYRVYCYCGIETDERHNKEDVITIWNSRSVLTAGCPSCGNLVGASNQ